MDLWANFWKQYLKAREMARERRMSGGTEMRTREKLLKSRSIILAKEYWSR